MSQQTLPTPTGPAAAAGAARGRLALAVIVACQLMLIVDATVMSVALPRIQQSLHFSPVGLSWVMNAYTLTFGGLLLLGGRAGDIFGRRRMFVTGVTLFTVASLVGGLAPTAGWLLAARVLQGVGAAMAGPSTLALIATTFADPARRIRALALLSGTASAGFAIGLVIGGLLTEAASWRWVLFINVPIGVVAALLAPHVVREPARHPGRLDLRGAVAATAGVALVVYGFIRAAGHGWSAPSTVALLVVGAVTLAVFVLTQARAAQPLMPLRLFTDRNRAAGYLGFLLMPAAMMSTFYFLTQYLQGVRGFSAVATGLAFLPMAVGIFTMSRVVPALLPRFGPRPLALAGISLIIAGMVWFGRLDVDSAYLPALFGPMLLTGIGGGLFAVPITPIVMSSVEPADAGAAGGALQTMQQIGATLGLAVLVAVFGAAAGGRNPADPHVFVDAMHSAFRAATVIAVAGLSVVLTLRRRVSG